MVEKDSRKRRFRLQPLICKSKKEKVIMNSSYLTNNEQTDTLEKLKAAFPDIFLSTQDVVRSLGSALSVEHRCFIFSDAKEQGRGNLAFILISPEAMPELLQIDPDIFNVDSTYAIQAKLSLDAYYAKYKCSDFDSYRLYQLTYYYSTSIVRKFLRKSELYLSKGAMSFSSMSDLYVDNNIKEMLDYHREVDALKSFIDDVRSKTDPCELATIVQSLTLCLPRLKDSDNGILFIYPRKDELFRGIMASLRRNSMRLVKD
jgi:hypothetical protein